MTVDEWVEGLVELEALKHLEFDPPCEIDGGCGDAATSAISCRRCGTTALLCEGHVAAYRRWFAKTRAHGNVVACKVCHVHMPSFDSGFVVVGL